MWGFILAVVSGLLMSVQGVFNTQVTQKSGLWIAAAFVQITAFIVCIIAWLVTGREGTLGDIFHIESKYMLLGGVMGAFITITVVKALEGLGPARSAMIIVIAQLLCSYIIELFGWFGIEQSSFEWKKLIGMAAAVTGIILFKS